MKRLLGHEKANLVAMMTATIIARAASPIEDERIADFVNLSLRICDEVSKHTFGYKGVPDDE